MLEQIVADLGVHENTVGSGWKFGHPSIDTKRPGSVLGTAFVAFLKARRKIANRLCKPGKFYCLRCWEPRSPDGGIVHYRPYTDRRGRLVVTCPSCQTELRRCTHMAEM